LSDLDEKNNKNVIISVNKKGEKIENTNNLLLEENFKD
jgi:hypothetical protein